MIQLETQSQKRTGYKIPRLGEQGAYDVVVNLIKHYTGKNKTFKDNFVEYAQKEENDKRTYNNDTFITKAVEILEKELNNDKPSIAMAMKYIIEKNLNTLVGFKNIYNSQYAWYLKK